ncbi:hypothetical protein R1sor_021535 [Riccia sorocarpa]|uniref:Uncharacterized protein n=1 Tax=Riccia sorocarpa TaxID=122646 RepID=A0ABD3GLK0_9MARC
MSRNKNFKQSEGQSALVDSHVSHNTRQAMLRKNKKVLQKDIPEERTSGVPADSEFDSQISRSLDADAADNPPRLQGEQGETPQSRQLPDVPPGKLTSPLGQGIARSLFTDGDTEGSAEPFRIPEKPGVDFTRRRASETWDIDAGLGLPSGTTGLNAPGVEIGVEFTPLDESLQSKSEAMAAESSSEADMRAIVPVDTVAREARHDIKSGGVLKSILNACKYQKSTPLPPVPLCMMRPTEAVRSLQTRNDIERLKDSVATLGYLNDHQAFFCQPFNIKGEEEKIKDTDIEKWDERWKREYKNYVDEIRGTEWDFLKDLFIFIWDGNHRWQAWMEYAKDHPTARDCHLRVKAILINGKGKETLLMIHFTTMNM